LLSLMIFLVGPGAESTFAQAAPPSRDPDSFVNQQRASQERVRARLDQELIVPGKIAFDFGGWYSAYLFEFDDGVDSSRTLRRHDLRLWSRLVLDHGGSEFYVRGRLSLLDFNSGDSYDGNDDDIQGPNLERGYYRFDLAKTFSAHNGPAIDGNVTFKAGRDLAQFGSGFALAAPLDHVLLTLTCRDIELAFLAGKTVGSSEDFDVSRLARRSHRDFWGVQATCRRLERHRPFAYALWQHDRNHEPTTTFGQRYDYDSFHAGVGSRGELVSRLYYTVECVYQTGHSFGANRFIHDSRIDAWGFDGRIEYLFPGRHRARASIEYIFGSGDPDRDLSPTGSTGGNEEGSTDSGFVAFGWRDTGLSFAPRYSNLHMWRVGGSLFPWPGHRRLDRFEIGTDWFLYYKHHRGAAVSDPTANVPSGYLGWEMDYFVNWEIASDLSWTARCGIFMPGDAFGDRTTRTFVLTGIVWSF